MNPYLRIAIEQVEEHHSSNTDGKLERARELVNRDPQNVDFTVERRRGCRVDNMGLSVVEREEAWSVAAAEKGWAGSSHEAGEIRPGWCKGGWGEWEGRRFICGIEKIS